MQDRAHCLHGEFLQNQHPAPAQQGSVDLEGRILRGRPDQSYCPALHVRKEGVLRKQTHVYIQLVRGRAGRETTRNMGAKEVKTLTISEVTNYHG